MSSRKPGHEPPTRQTPVPLGVTPYERVASTLVAVVVLLGAVVFAMLVMVLTLRATGSQRAVPVTLLEEGAGRGDHEAGSARDEKNAQVDELDEFFPPPMEAAIQAVSASVSSDITLLEALDDQIATFGSGEGQGDSRQAGPAGEGGGDIVPRWERWQVRFSSDDVNAYARQLDFFEIELAAMGGGKSQVDYASKLSQPTPVRRSGPADAEKRLYMTWRTGELIEADKSLLAKAGIDTVGRIVLQLYPPKTEALLADLEQKQAGARSLKEIKRTVFGVKSAGNQYQFIVISQEYRPAP